MGHGSLDAVRLQEQDVDARNELLSDASNPIPSWTPFFIAVVLFIGGVSAYDGYLVVRTGPLIRDFEKNPVGLYLINCADGSPDIFLRVKAAGTLLTLVGLAVLHRHSRRLAGPVEFALVVFQGGLLLFLENPFC
jgi:hypothetical protein